MLISKVAAALRRLPLDPTMLTLPLEILDEKDSLYERIANSPLEKMIDTLSLGDLNLEEVKDASNND